MEARKEYANKIFYLIISWLIGMVILLLLSGFGGKSEWFKMADSVLIALITTTTASVLGLFVIVANYFFKNNANKLPSNKNKSKKSSSADKTPDKAK